MIVVKSKQGRAKGIWRWITSIKRKKKFVRASLKIARASKLMDNIPTSIKTKKAWILWSHGKASKSKTRFGSINFLKLRKKKKDI